MALVSAAKFIGTIKIVGDTIFISGTAISTGFFAGGAVGLVAAVSTFIVVLNSARDRCTKSDADEQCAGGVVVAVKSSFSSTLDEFAPWQAMHDRVDVLVKSFFWQIVEFGNAFVHCTDDAWPRKSELFRVYFYERRVCKAAQGAAAGAAVGMVAGVIAAAYIAAALCITVILCVLGLILAAAAAVALVLAGAAAGGQVAKRAAENQDPTAEGETGTVTLTIGHLVTVRGPMERRGYDDGANVIYWSNSANFHGDSMSPQPFSYCEINDEFQDSCERAPIQ